MRDDKHESSEWCECSQCEYQGIMPVKPVDWRVEGVHHSKVSRPCPKCQDDLPKMILENHRGCMLVDEGEIQ